MTTPTPETTIDAALNRLLGEASFVIGYLQGWLAPGSRPPPPDERRDDLEQMLKQLLAARDNLDAAQAAARKGRAP
jgi:hypothetical protein